MILQVIAPPGKESSPRSPKKLLHVSYAGSRFTPSSTSRRLIEAPCSTNNPLSLTLFWRTSAALLPFRRSSSKMVQSDLQSNSILFHEDVDWSSWIVAKLSRTPIPTIEFFWYPVQKKTVDTVSIFNLYFLVSSCTTDSRTWKDSWINNNDTGNIFKISKQSHQSLKSWK